MLLACLAARMKIGMRKGPGFTDDVKRRDVSIFITGFQNKLFHIVLFEFSDGLDYHGQVLHLTCEGSMVVRWPIGENGSDLLGWFGHGPIQIDGVLRIIKNEPLES